MSTVRLISITFTAFTDKNQNLSTKVIGIIKNNLKFKLILDICFPKVLFFFCVQLNRFFRIDK